MLVKRIRCTGEEPRLKNCEIEWCDETCPSGGPVEVLCA